MTSTPYKIITLAAALVVLILDQFSKLAARTCFFPGEAKTVIAGFFDLTYVRNTGAVWGCLHDRNEWLTLVSLLALVLVFVFYRYLVDGRRGGIQSFVIGCIAGGILGNLVDRIRFGWVIDFLDFYAYGWHWPAFNIADAAICSGVGLYLLTSLLSFDRYDAAK